MGLVNKVDALVTMDAVLLRFLIKMRIFMPLPKKSIPKLAGIQYFHRIGIANSWNIRHFHKHRCKILGKNGRP